MALPRTCLTLTNLPDGNVLADRRQVEPRPQQRGGRGVRGGGVVARDRTLDDARQRERAALLPLGRRAAARRPGPRRRRLGRRGRRRPCGSAPTRSSRRPTSSRAPVRRSRRPRGPPGTASAFTIGTPDAAGIRSVAITAPAAVTHNFDENSRFVPLSFSVVPGGLQIAAPPERELGTAGPVPAVDRGRERRAVGRPLDHLRLERAKPRSRSKRRQQNPTPATPTTTSAPGSRYQGPPPAIGTGFDEHAVDDLVAETS